MPIIGHFDILLPNKKPAVLRLNIHKFVKNMISISADTAVVVAAADTSVTVNKTDKKTRCCIWRKDSVDRLNSQIDTAIPYGDNYPGFDMGTWITIKTGDRIVFYANGVKYYAMCQLVPDSDTFKSYSLYSAHDSRTGMLDLLEKLQFENMVKPTPSEPTPAETKPVEPKPVDAKPVDVKSVDAKPTPELVEIASESGLKPVKVEPKVFRFNLEFKYVNFRGIKCWEMPDKITNDVKITIDAKTSYYRLCMLYDDLSFESSELMFKSTVDHVRVEEGCKYFWIADADDKNVDFNIVKVEFV
jgi:hypothetical protein